MEEEKIEEVKNNAGKGMAITALVMGIISIILVFLSIFIISGIIGIILGLVGLILSIISLKKGKSGLAIGGLVTSIIGMILCLIITGVVGCICAGTATYLAKENSVIGMAKPVITEENKKAELKEKISLAFSSAKINYDTNRYSTYSNKTLKECFKDELDRTFEGKNYTMTDQYIGGWKINIDGYTFRVSTSGTVTE